jgi:hypothetical protein
MTDWAGNAGWHTGQVVTAGELNAEVYQNMLYLYEHKLLKGSATRSYWGYGVAGSGLSRDINTTYQNTSGKIQVVIISCKVNAAGCYARFYLSPATPPNEGGYISGTIEIAGSTLSDDITIPITVFIPIDWYYGLFVESGLLSYIYDWTEWDLG